MKSRLSLSQDFEYSSPISALKGIRGCLLVLQRIGVLWPCFLLYLPLNWIFEVGVLYSRPCGCFCIRTLEIWLQQTTFYRAQRRTDMQIAVPRVIMPWHINMPSTDSKDFGVERLWSSVPALRRCIKLRFNQVLFWTLWVVNSTWIREL